MTEETEQLRKKLSQAKLHVAESSLWRHNKTGNVYFVAMLALRESDKQVVVVYCSNSEQVSWTRPVDEFLERFHQLFTLPSIY